MTLPRGTIPLILMFMASSTFPASGSPSQPQVASVTGEIRNPISRELTFSYELPSALEDFDQGVVLDSLNRFAFEVPVVRGTVVSGRYEGGEPRWEWVQWLGAVLFDHDPLAFFVEPGDSLHVAIEEGFFSPSISFSGSNADNSRLIAEWVPRFYSFRLDYEDLEVEDFRRQIDQRRQDQFEFLTERGERYALSPGFLDYATAYLNCEWAEEMISYPGNYRAINRRWNGSCTGVKPREMARPRKIRDGPRNRYLATLFGTGCSARFLPPLEEAVTRHRLDRAQGLAGCCSVYGGHFGNLIGQECHRTDDTLYQA